MSAVNWGNDCDQSRYIFGVGVEFVKTYYFNTKNLNHDVQIFIVLLITYFLLTVCSL
jgi:hypothetical protein